MGMLREAGDMLAKRTYNYVPGPFKASVSKTIAQSLLKRTQKGHYFTHFSGSGKGPLRSNHSKTWELPKKLGS